MGRGEIPCPIFNCSRNTQKDGGSISVKGGVVGLV